MKVFTAHQRKSSYSTTMYYIPEQPDERRTASKSRGMEGRRHEKNACRLYSALAMTLKVIFSLFVVKCQSIEKIFEPKVEETLEDPTWNGRTSTREKRVLALFSFSHDTQGDF